MVFACAETTRKSRWDNSCVSRVQNSSRSSWNERSGSVSEEFEEWKAVDSDIRAFLRLTHRWSQSQYDLEWKNAEEEFSERFNPDRHDPDGNVDLFHQKVGGLWHEDYAWMVNAAALRDSVTAFEVYLEKSLLTVLKRFTWVGEGEPPQRLQFRKQMNFDSPSWNSLVQVYAQLGPEIDTEEVKYVRSLRHLLAHQRGELRTDEKRKKFSAEISAADKDHFFGPARDIPLNADRVLEMMDTLGSKVRETDPAPWAYVYGGDQLPREILSLAEGKKSVLELVKVD